MPRPLRAGSKRLTRRSPTYSSKQLMPRSPRTGRAGRCGRPGRRPEAAGADKSWHDRGHMAAEVRSDMPTRRAITSSLAPEASRSSRVAFRSSSVPRSRPRRSRSRTRTPRPGRAARPGRPRPRPRRLRLLEAAQSCTTEVLVMQPCVAHETRELRLARPLVLEALRAARRAGSSTRTPPAATPTPAAHRRTPAGRGQVRHHQGGTRPLPVFDRKTAFSPAARATRSPCVYEGAGRGLPAGSTPGLGSPRSTSTPARHGYAGDAGGPEGDPARPARLRRQGDEVIARRVGMSERTSAAMWPRSCRTCRPPAASRPGVLAARTGPARPVRGERGMSVSAVRGGARGEPLRPRS